MKTTRRIVTILAALAATFMLFAGSSTAATPKAAAAAAGNGEDPVILIHGLFGSESNWGSITADLLAAGYSEDQIFTFGYNSTSQSNVVTAQKLAVKVDQVLAQTGASKVDLVGHSMGSLNSRYCIKYDDCAGKVDDWVSLAGPNHGAQNATLCWWMMVTCREMSPGSAFLTKLNAGAPVPAGVQGSVLWSRQDGVVTPATSAPIEGLNNVEFPGVGHIGFLTNQDVSAKLVELLAS